MEHAGGPSLLQRAPDCCRARLRRYRLRAGLMCTARAHSVQPKGTVPWAKMATVKGDDCGEATDEFVRVVGIDPKLKTARGTVATLAEDILLPPGGFPLLLLQLSKPAL